MDVRIHAHPNEDRLALQKRNAVSMFLQGVSVAEVAIYFCWRTDRVEAVLRQALRQLAALVAAQAKADSNGHNTDTSDPSAAA